MSATRVALTAGFNRSIPSEALAERLHRSGVTVVGVLVVSAMNLTRIRSMIRQRGLDAVIRKFCGSLASDRPHAKAALYSPVREHLKRYEIHPVGLRAWGHKHGVPICGVGDLNGDVAIRSITRWRPDAVVYTGGGILRNQFLQACPPVINAHAGPLPEIRGMNAAEWSAMLGCRSEVTVHFIDRGIDTGLAIRSIPYERASCSSVEQLRERAVVAGVEGLHDVVQSKAFEHRGLRQPPTAAPHRQCFIMAPALVEILSSRLNPTARGI